MLIVEWRENNPEDLCPKTAIQDIFEIQNGENT
jgi:hypothetical protein